MNRSTFMHHALKWFNLVIHIGLSRFRVGNARFSMWLVQWWKLIWDFLSMFYVIYKALCSQLFNTVILLKVVNGKTDCFDFKMSNKQTRPTIKIMNKRGKAMQQHVFQLSGRVRCLTVTANRHNWALPAEIEIALSLVLITIERARSVNRHVSN